MTIMELYRDYARIAAQLGNDRCQEGSEHFFAYCAEYLAKRTFLHGALLATGIFVMSYLQDNEHEHTVQLMNDMGLEYSLKNTGLSEKKFIQTLKTLPDFVEQGGYYYSIIDDREITESRIDELIKLLS